MERRILIASLALAPLLACSLLSLPGTDGVAAPIEEASTPDVSVPDVVTADVVDAGGGNYAIAILGDRPKRWWRFDEKDGETAREQIQAADGVYGSSGVTLGVPGALANDPGTAVSLDGKSGDITLPRDLDFTGNLPISVEVWVKVPKRDGESFGFLVDHETWDTRGGWSLIFDDNHLEYELYGGDGGGKIITANGIGDPADGQWHYVAVTYDGATVKTFLDANLVVQRASLPTVVYDTDAGIKWLVGRQSCDSCGQHLEGVIDELAIYDYALSQTRLKAHFDAAH